MTKKMDKSRHGLSRRRFSQLGAAGAASFVLPKVAYAQGAPKVVVVGGGFGGATAAKYLKRFDKNIQVTLVEPNRTFVTCPFSNTVIGGMNPISSITHNFDAMKKAGVEVIHDMATKVDAQSKEVVLASGKTLAFDRAVVSPGIDFRWGTPVGYTPDVADDIPHAWKAGPQTLLLRKQLEAMDDGGVFIISPPDNPFRCPPGPGERISLVANYLKTYKPKSKIICLDPKAKFSKQGLFKEAWAKLYPGMVEYRNQEEDGVLREVRAKDKMLITDFGETKGDVVNVIPPQKAGAIADASGLADNTGWCPVKQQTFESTLAPGVHVIGDASIAAPMPKSGFSASTQAKVAAAAIAAMLKGEEPGQPKFVNTCYSLAAPGYGISVAMVYGYDNGKIVKVKGSGGLSPSGADDYTREQEAAFAEGWYKSISEDIWG